MAVLSLHLSAMSGVAICAPILGRVLPVREGLSDRKKAVGWRNLPRSKGRVSLPSCIQVERRRNRGGRQRAPATAGIFGVFWPTDDARDVSVVSPGSDGTLMEGDAGIVAPCVAVVGLHDDALQAVPSGLLEPMAEGDSSSRRRASTFARSNHPGTGCDYGRGRNCAGKCGCACGFVAKAGGWARYVRL